MKTSTVVGGLVAAVLSTALAGCGGDRARVHETRAPVPSHAAYKTNAADASYWKFGDKQFDTRTDVVNFNGKEYVFAQIPQGYALKVDGKAVDGLPFVAFDRSRMTTILDLDQRSATYGHEDGTAIGFVRDPSITKVITTRQAQRYSAGSELVTNVPEDRFEVPFLSLPGNSRIAYAIDGDEIVFVPDPQIAINNARGTEQGGLIEFIGKGYFVARTGKLELIPRASQPAATKPAKPVMTIMPAKIQRTTIPAK